MRLPSAQEVVTALYAALRLARGDGAAMAMFDRTVDGFWRSFFAAVLALPAFLVIKALAGPGEAPLGTGIGDLLGLGLIYAVLWLAYPVAIYQVCDLIDREERFVDYVVAYNWAAFWQLTLQMAVRVVEAIGLLPGALVTLLTGISIGVILWYLWYIARIGLAIGGGLAAAIVAFDLVLGILLRFLLEWALR